MLQNLHPSRRTAATCGGRRLGPVADPLGGRTLLIVDQYRDVANLVAGIRVAVRFGDLVERTSAPDHRAQLAGVDQLLQEDQVGLLRIGCAGDESRSSGE